MTRNGIELRVLGPLEMWCDGEPVAIGGAKQRAVLAVLLLREGEVVPVERLVDEVWGAEPPPSAARTIESYVSRLRQLFNGHGPTVSRRGSGYVIDLCDAALDARMFLAEHESAALAAAVDDHKSVLERTEAALAFWRGPALADVALASAGRAEADRLEELRLQTYELRFDAELALGRNEGAIGELQALVAQNPYRERFVAQLMLALYRCGRHAEALEAYEQTRRRLDDDLGLQPSAELQQLSGQIVRQDPQLRRPAITTTHSAPSRPQGRRTRRMIELVLVGSIVAAVMALTASGGAQTRLTAEPAAAVKLRVALVVPKRNPDRRLNAGLAKDLREASSTWEVDTTFLPVEETSTRQRANLVRRIESGGFGLVVVLGDGVLATTVSSLVRRMPRTTFAFVDASLADLSLQGVSNASAWRFADEQSSQVIGYLSALVPTRRGLPRVDVVSVVSGPRTPHRERVIAGFEQGVANARPGVDVLVGYADDVFDPTECERLANEQIDRGSDLVFVEAEHCGLGAIAVARLRGVWATGGYDDGVTPGPHVLLITGKDWQRAVFGAINDYVFEVTRFGEDLELGLDDDYAVGFDRDGSLSPVVSESLWSKVVRRCSQIRQRAAAAESP